ncbi:MAG: hypothetical protein AB7I27_18450 [Bacteriovoracaceae bacterium]
MRKILIVTFLTLSLPVIAQDGLEEAIILNEEMQFLQDSAKNVKTETLSVNSITPSSTRERSNESSLENVYFSDDKDQIKLRTAAPKRRAAPED